MSASIRPTQSAIQMAKNLDLSLDMQRDFGASGSNFTTTGTTIAGSTTLTLTAAGDFQNGQGITIFGAGNVLSNVVPDPEEAPILSQRGGSSNFTVGEVIYVAYAYLGTTGITEISPVASITINGAGNAVRVQIPMVFGALGVAVYNGTSSTDLYEVGTAQINGSSSVGYPDAYVDGFLTTGNATDPTRTEKQPIAFIFNVLAATTANAPATANNSTIAPAVTASVSGSTGSTTYDYYVCPLSWQGGLLLPSSASVSITNGPTTASTSDSIELSWGMQSVPAYAIYGASTNPSGSQGLLGVTPTPSFTDTGAGVIQAIPPGLPDTLPSASIAEILSTTIVSGSGTTSLVLADSATTAVSGTFVSHSDRQALQKAIATLVNAGSGELRIPAGDYYLDGPVYLDNEQVNGGFLWLKYKLVGAGIKASVIRMVPGIHGPMFTTNLSQMAQGNGVSYITFQDLAINGNLFYNYNKQAANYTTFAVPVYALAGNTTWLNVQIENCYDGLWLTGLREGGAGNNTIINCNIFDAYHTGACLTGDSNVTSQLVGSCGGNVYNGENLIYSQKDAIDGGIFLAGSDTGITNVEFYANSVNLRVNGQENVITGNLFASSQSHNVSLEYGASNNLLATNKFQMSTVSTAPTQWDAIHMDGSVERTAVVGNIWTNSNSDHYAWQYAVSEGAGCDYNTIAANTFNGAFATAGAPINFVGTHSLAIQNDSPQGTYQLTQSLAGTAGSIAWTMPDQGTRKVFIAYADAYAEDNTTNGVITFPTAYTYTPVITTNTTGLTISATTTTLTITAPDTTTTYSGVIEVIGI